MAKELSLPALWSAKDGMQDYELAVSTSYITQTHRNIYWALLAL
jgi:hypothetical protein